MGVKGCCRREDSPLELANDQPTFTEALSVERRNLQERYSEKLYEGKNILKNQTECTNKTKASNTLKTMVSDLEDNFYMITLYCNLEKIEMRLRKEEYNNFFLVKNRFLEFYSRAVTSFDFYLLVEEFKKFMVYLDTQKCRK